MRRRCTRRRMQGEQLLRALSVAPRDRCGTQRSLVSRSSQSQTSASMRREHAHAHRLERRRQLRRRRRSRRVHRAKRAGFEMRSCFNTVSSGNATARQGRRTTQCHVDVSVIERRCAAFVPWQLFALGMSEFVLPSRRPSRRPSPHRLFRGAGRMKLHRKAPGKTLADATQAR